MRLHCPNCDAQYEVDEKVIPQHGRDVQCSNCGHTWFQLPVRFDDDTAAEQGVTPVAGDASEDHADSAAAEPTTASTDVYSEAAPEPHFSTEEEDDEALRAALSETVDITAPEVTDATDEPFDDDIDVATPVAGRTPASTISDDIRDILREEAEFSAPVSEPDTLESQPDLGLDEAPHNSDQIMREKMARLRGVDPADPAMAAGAAHSKRRELLPDIEEINSTLSAESDRDADGSVPDDETLRIRDRRRGFRSAFLPLVFLATLLVVVYAFAPAIADSVPSLAGVMDSYVNFANGFRSSLDGAMSHLAEQLDGLLNQLNSSSDAAAAG